jgi:hypothetical protein
MKKKTMCERLCVRVSLAEAREAVFVSTMMMMMTMQESECAFCSREGARTARAVTQKQNKNYKIIIKIIIKNYIKIYIYRDLKKHYTRGPPGATPRRFGDGSRAAAPSSELLRRLRRFCAVFGADAPFSVGPPKKRFSP